MRNEQEWLDLAARYCFRGRMDGGEWTGPVFLSARDSVVTDVRGREFLDFNSGQMCCALGHNHPRVIHAIEEACRTLIHVSEMYLNVMQIELARRVADILPPPLQKSSFHESGSSSNEAAMAIAKVYTGRFEIASPHASFHGLTSASRAVTFSGWRKGLGPLAPGAYAMLTPYRYRCEFCQKAPDCTLACLNTSFELLDAQSTGSMAAVITEVLFSAGGVIPVPPGWLRALKAKCEERGMLLILDEAQTGLAKLGTMFAFEQEGVVPDVVTISKHFGGGVPISATITSQVIEEEVVMRGYVGGHSHDNSALACAAAIASLDIIIEDGLTKRATVLGDYFQRVLRDLAERHEVIGDVRGKGLIQGVEFVEDREHKVPAGAAGKAIQQRCLEKGLICSARRGGSVLRFVPPFTTTPAQFDRAGEIIGSAIREVQDAQARRVR